MSVINTFPSVALLLLVSEMIYNVSSGTLNTTIPYHTLLLQSAELIVYRGVIDVCQLDAVKLFFQIATAPTIFVRFLQNVVHMIYVPVRKKVWNRFSKFDFNIFGEFLKFGRLSL